MSTKWAAIDDPHIPAREFARTVLAERMKVVETLLPRATHHHGEDIEHVHQLRVGCRRAAAALRAFAPLMREKPKKLKKWLGAIRDAAGPARDIDVLVARFEKEKPNSVTGYATRRLQEERLAAQKALVKIARRASSGKLDDAVTDGLSLLEVKQGKKPRLDKFSRDAVRLSYLPFARLAASVDPTTSELHELRIAGKRLRYSLEIFHGLDPALVDQAYSIVEELQSRLGEINDHATAQALYQSWLADVSPNDLAADLAARVIAEHQSISRLKGQFARWWSSEQVARLHGVITQLCG